MKRVVVSGYFNPLHIGHLSYLIEAKKLGDWLTVIVNSDKQVALKGSQPFMNELERGLIIMHLKPVDSVIIARDEDGSVCKTLEYLKPDIFAKGGDRTIDNIPERNTCEELGIQMIFNVGGSKIQSSSKLKEKLLKYGTG